MTQLRVWLTVALAAGCLSGAAAAPQAQWRRLDSPNFIVIGEAGASDLREIAVKFEGYREMLGRVLGTKVTSNVVPTVVTVFAHDRTFTPFKPLRQGKRVDVAGLFVPGRDVNHILMIGDDNPFRLRLIFHEYTHLIVSNTGQRMPVWLGEGIAEYYSTFELSRGGREAMLGGLIEDHLLLLNDRQLLTLPDLLNVTHDSPLYNESTRRGVFYAQSWALTHMILLGEPNRTQQLSAYLNHLSSGAAPVDAWQRAFGAEDMGKALEAYIRRQLFRAYAFKFSDALAKFNAQTTAISPAETQAYLADVLVELDDFAEAANRLAIARKTDPSNARAHLIDARLRLATGKLDEAEASLKAAGALEDWYMNYLAGVAVAELSDRRQETTAGAAVEAARTFFQKAADGRAELPNAAARLAALAVRGSAKPSPETRAAAERAHAQAPGRHDYTLLLAQVLAMQGEYQAARTLLGPLLTPAYPANVRDSARRFLGTIASVENSMAQRNAAAAGGLGVKTTVATRTDVPEPVVRPLFREMKSGEERLEGTLERIDCTADGAPTFSVRTATEVVKAGAAKFADVEFLTYRNDLKGNISCGPVTPALPVYLTWRAGATAGSRLAVALEFLPKKDGPQ